MCLYYHIEMLKILEAKKNSVNLYQKINVSFYITSLDLCYKYRGLHVCTYIVYKQNNLITFFIYKKINI